MPQADESNETEWWLLIIGIIGGGLALLYYLFSIEIISAPGIIIKPIIKYSLYIPEFIFNSIFFWKMPFFIENIIEPIYHILSIPLPAFFTPQPLLLSVDNKLTIEQCISVATSLNSCNGLSFHVYEGSIAWGPNSEDYGSVFTPYNQIKAAFIALDQPRSPIVSMASINLSQLSTTNQLLSYIGTMFLPYFIFLYIIIIKKFRKKRFYKTVHTADSILTQERTIWHTIEPMLNVHPELEKDLEKGEWAMAKRAEDFAIEMKLLIKKDDLIELNHDKSADVFADQCGRKFKGVNSFTREERWLYATFITKANRNGNTAQILLDLMNDFHTSRKISKADRNFKLNELNTLSDSMIDKYTDSEVEQLIFSEHYHTLCIMSRALDEARLDGVLATSNFIWLRPLNRSLWYMLSNTGRGGIKKESGSASFIEAAGPTCHMMSERILSKKIQKPDVEQAIIALDQYWFETNPNYKQFYTDKY